MNSVANGVASTPICGTDYCKCVRMTATIAPGSLKLLLPNQPKLRLAFVLHWTLTCLKGHSGCRGNLHVVAPKGRDYATRLKRGNEFAPGSIFCEGNCGNTEGSESFRLVSTTGLGPLVRGGETLPLVIERDCNGRKLRPLRLSIAFDRDGGIDLAKSRLH